MGDHVKEEWLRVGRVIRRIRTSRGFSLEQLSKRLTISPAMISAIEGWTEELRHLQGR